MYLLKLKTLKMTNENGDMWIRLALIASSLVAVIW